MERGMGTLLEMFDEARVLDPDPSVDLKAYEGRLRGQLAEENENGFDVIATAIKITLCRRLGCGQNPNSSDAALAYCLINENKTQETLSLLSRLFPGGDALSVNIQTRIETILA